MKNKAECLLYPWTRNPMELLVEDANVSTTSRECENTFSLYEGLYREFWDTSRFKESSHKKNTEHLNDLEKVTAVKYKKMKEYKFLITYVKNLIKVEEMFKKYTVISEEAMTFSLPDELYDEFWDARHFVAEFYEVADDICYSIKGNFLYKMDGAEYSIPLAVLVKHIFMQDSTWAFKEGVIIPWEYRDAIENAIENWFCKEA